jgi:hypothetical protein
MSQAREPIQAPLCLALVLADAIWRDQATQKRTILGTFSALFAAQFPASQNMSVYCALTDGRGITKVELRIVDIQDEDLPIASATAEVDFSDSRMVVEIDTILGGVVFPHPGEYRIQMLGAGDLMMERRLVVIHAPLEETTDESDDGAGR